MSKAGDSPENDAQDQGYEVDQVGPQSVIEDLDADNRDPAEVIPVIQQRIARWALNNRGRTGMLKLKAQRIAPPEMRNDDLPMVEIDPCVPYDLDDLRPLVGGGTYFIKLYYNRKTLASWFPVVFEGRPTQYGQTIDAEIIQPTAMQAPGRVDANTMLLLKAIEAQGKQQAAALGAIAEAFQTKMNASPAPASEPKSFLEQAEEAAALLKRMRQLGAMFSSDGSLPPPEVERERGLVDFLEDLISEHGETIAGMLATVIQNRAGIDPTIEHDARVVPFPDAEPEPEPEPEANEN